MSDVDDLYGALRKDMAALHARWKVFCQLYATDEETVELLNESAAGFFGLCQDTLIDDVLLRIGRLTDKHRTHGKDNLSMEKLVRIIDGTAHSELGDTMRVLLDDAKSKCAFVRDHRNRRLAHSAWNPDASPLPVIEKRKIEDALASLRELMAEIESRLYDEITAYENPLMKGDGNGLINRLRQARTFRQRRRQSRSG